MAQDPAAAAPEAPEEDPSESNDQEGGKQEDPMELVSQVGEGLQQLMQIQGVPPAIKQELGQILAQFTDLVQKALGGNGPQPADQGAVSAQGGQTGVPMGPQGRQ